jgi:16S rRNA (cytosine1402-N4)-methyltransferase
MVREVLEVLAPREGQRALDLTVGMGGHAVTIGERLGTDGLLVGIDADRDALEAAKERLTEDLDCEVRLFHGRFSDAPKLMRQLGISGFDAILADLGVGSHQLDDEQRGFSFESEAPLDMRYDTGGGPTAREVINRTSESPLADIFYELGEERYSRQIAAEICRRRREDPIRTPAELAEICKKIYARRGSGRTWRIHPATRVMMALRIYVNRELEELEALLEDLPEMLTEGGRVAILTYHSLEARRVKQAWRDQGREGRMEEFSDSPLMPTDEEIEDNPRARSAQLRAARRPHTGRQEVSCSR